jgi:hypothetical protein
MTWAFETDPEFPANLDGMEAFARGESAEAVA